MAKFPRGHAANKKLIASCAANGVAIEGLEGASNFRFYPAERERDAFKGRENCGPSGRGSVLCGAAKPKHIKNWNPARTSLDPQYEVAMVGDDWPLTRARKAYAGRQPEAAARLSGSAGQGPPRRDDGRTRGRPRPWPIC